MKHIIDLEPGQKMTLHEPVFKLYKNKDGETVLDIGGEELILSVENLVILKMMIERKKTQIISEIKEPDLFNVDWEKVIKETQDGQ
jgi:hypothetical protein